MGNGKDRKVSELWEKVLIAIVTAAVGALVTNYFSEENIKSEGEKETIPIQSESYADKEVPDMIETETKRRSTRLVDLDTFDENSGTDENALIPNQKCSFNSEAITD